MTTVPCAPGVNNNSRPSFASGSAFPPALPPRHPATTVANNSTDAYSAPQLMRSDDNNAGMLRHPLITASDYSDRKQLVSHISFLSGQLQRAEIMLRSAPRTMVSDEDLARFDPLLAQGHIERLESSLAQVALLREVELGQSRALEEEVHALRLERNHLVERVDALDSRSMALETENKQLSNSLSSAQLEVERLRLEETALSRRLEVIDQLQNDGHRYQGMSVIVAPPRQQQECVASRAMKELQMQETLQRLFLLLDMMMEPIYIAFDAGVVWMTETQLHRASVQINNAVVPDVTNDSVGLPKSVEGNSPTGDVGHDTLPPAALVGVESRSEQQLQHELTMIKEKCRVIELQKERFKCLLEEEQQRTEAMAKEHYQQLQKVHDQVVHERQHIMEDLMAEVEEQMRNAFRDGRLYEKRVQDEKSQKRRVATNHKNSSALPEHQKQRLRRGNKPLYIASITSDKKASAGTSSSSSSCNGGR